jgi:antitoxin CptB
VPELPAAALNRLRWRCRRGMRELDVLLTGYLERRLAGDDAAALTLFADLLDEGDTDLYLWLTRRAAPAHPYAGLVQEILAAAGAPDADLT